MNARKTSRGLIAGFVGLPFLALLAEGPAAAVARVGIEEHGVVLWEDQVDVGAFDEVGGAVASNGPLVFAVGTGFTTTSGLDWLVRAYDAHSGALVWADQFDRGGRGEWARGVQVEGSRVFVSGYSSDETGNRDIAVRAYDASSGTVLWSTFIDVAGRRDESRVNTLSVAGDRVFVGGFGQNTAGDWDMVVAALDARTGQRLWCDVANPGGNDLVERLVVSGNKLFAVGRAQIGGLFHMAVRAYEARTGALLWSDIHPSGVTLEPVTAALATDGDRVFAGYASGENFDFLVRAYDSHTGAVQWEDIADKGGDEGANAAAVHAGRLYVVGQGGAGCDFRPVPSNCDQMIRAYDARLGTLVWENMVDDGGGDDQIFAVVSHGNTVVTNGLLSKSFDDVDMYVRAYDASTGHPLWEDRIDKGAEDVGNALAAHGDLIIAGGRVTNDRGDVDFFVRAYK